MGQKIYVFDWAMQSWVDGMDADSLPTLESMARPDVTAVVIATGDKETDEAFWSAVSQIKRRVEQEYTQVCDEPQPTRWIDGGWNVVGDWAPERSFALMAGTETIGLVTAIATEIGIP